MRTQRDKLQDKLLLEQVITALDISPDRLSVDECGDWIIPSQRASLDGMYAKIYTDGSLWYIFVSTGSKRQWSAVKRKLAFMTRQIDGDEEGTFYLDRLPTAAEAAVLR